MNSEHTTETYKLCKELYELSKWGRMDNSSPTDEYYFAGLYHVNTGETDHWRVCKWEEFVDSGRLHYSLGRRTAYPKYTIEYLLDILPAPFKYDNNDCAVEVRRTKGDKYKWSANIRTSNSQKFKQVADTPLKAVLMLCIALFKEGAMK